MDRKQILTALDALDDATVNLQTAFCATGESTLLDQISSLYELYDEFLNALPNAPEQPSLLD